MIIVPTSLLPYLYSHLEFEPPPLFVKSNMLHFTPPQLRLPRIIYFLMPELVPLLIHLEKEVTDETGQPKVSAANHPCASGSGPTSDQRSPLIPKRSAVPPPSPTFGDTFPTVEIDLRRSFYRIILIALILYAILDSDFPTNFNLLVECRNARQIDRTTDLSFREMTTFTTACDLSALDTDIT
ncbi:unnamed protein product [Schistocephalus solidus]|uniref:Uncharacterized protein n=1 Tax=Schistocephalus solidus TaxID=70667 RepID=A0A183S9U7_SCHSO|nr:unnamed protein product [Schistocephalus solidus]